MPFVLPILLLVGAGSLLPAGAGAQAAADSIPAPASTAATAAAAAGPLLDGPVDRESYRLGPGDVVTLSIFGDLNRTYTLTVAPEGTVLIPTAGVARVLGLDLDEAEAVVSERIFQFYRNVSVDLTLDRLRSFKVFLVGDLPSPGVRTASSATRVSEIVPPANSTGILRRNVLLRRSGGDSLRVDLAGFIQAGDLEQNPILREGDMVVVPRVDETISVFGRVSYPGDYEYRPGESLAELLRIANGGASFPASAADTVRIARFVGPRERSVFALAREEAVGAAGGAMRMEPFDAVFVPEVSDYKRQTTATVRGEVRRPGTYPIRPDTTTLRELVAMAGGFTEEASLVDAVLRRGAGSARTALRGALENVPPEFLSTDERRILQVTSAGDSRNVVIDFQRLFAAGEEAYDQPLQASDTLTVPERRDEVVVLGAVARPGIVRYVPEEGIDYFVELAGGFTRKADRNDLVVVKARLGTRIPRRDVSSLEPGDQIIVPYKVPRTFLERVQTVEGIVSTIAGVVLTIVALGRL